MSKDNLDDENIVTPGNEDTASPATQDEEIEGAMSGGSDSIDVAEIHSGEESEPSENAAAEDPHSTISADLIRGHINTIILRALYERDKYGYEIINDIEAKSHGQYTLKQPTLYSALKRLENQGYIKAYWKKDDVTAGGRRKYFTLTEIGKEMTEKNLAEWEYSRTIIDSLISDRAFDFNQPAPTPVDFTILRDSVSRVPNLKNDKIEGNKEEQNPADSLAEAERDAAYSMHYVIHTEQPPSIESSESVQAQQSSMQPEQSTQISSDESAAMQQSVQENTQQAVQSEIRERAEQTAETQNNQINAGQQQSNSVAPASSARKDNIRQYSQDIRRDDYRDGQPPYNTEFNRIQQESPAAVNSYSAGNFADEQQQQYASQKQREADEQARRRAHENYLKLISEPVQNREPQSTIAASNAANGGIYTNRPAPERDYRNLIDGIFNKAVANGSVQTNYGSTERQQPQHSQQRSYSPPPIVDRGNSDGIKVMPSTDYRDIQQSTDRTVYDKGKTLLKCSAIVLGVCTIEFIVCLALLGALQMHWAYPVTLLAIGLVQFCVFAILNYKGVFGHCAKPTSSGYLSTSIIITIIAILIICILAFLLNINFTVAGDVVKYMVMPSVTALNITIFATAFYFLVK